MIIKPIIWKYYQRFDGTHQIKIRITKDRTTSYYPLELFVEEKHFSDTCKFGHWVNKSRPNSNTINAKIKNAYYRLESFAAKYPDLSPKAIVENVDGDNDSFYTHFEKKLAYVRSKYGIGTYKRLKSIKSKMEQFSPKLTVKEVNIDWVRSFEVFLLKKRGNAVNTVASNMKAIKAIVNDLVRKGEIEYKNNPFLHYKIKTVRVKKQRLTAEEIAQLESFDLTPNTNLWHVKNAYLFSFYCAGIRFADLAKLTWENIESRSTGKRLVYTMGKTTRFRSIKLIPRAEAILCKYSGEGYIFPILKKLGNSSVENKISSMNAFYNHSLKQVAKMAEINPVISFHSSRHSFADWAIKNGVDIRTLKDLLGHDKVATTEIYAKDFYEEEADQTLEKLFS